MILKKIVFSLICANLILSPAYAYDTDIFLSSGSSTSTAEPNILIILDTSDSMNIPEAWKEYPGDYDSHVEYMPNDTTYILNIGCSGGGCSSSGNATSDVFTNSAKNASVPADNVQQLPQGYFSGTTSNDRISFKQDLYNYANGTNSFDDKGNTSYSARKNIRNYGKAYTTTGAGSLSNSYLMDTSWLYWVNANNNSDPDDEIASVIQDPHLWSNSFNKFRGIDAANKNGSTNGTAQPTIRGGIVFGNDSYLNNYSSRNVCLYSAANLTPSTVQAPTAYARNDGYVLKGQWKRWDPYIAADLSQVSSYPTTSALVNASASYNPNGLVDNNKLPIKLQGTSGSPSHSAWTNLMSDTGGYSEYYSLTNVSNFDNVNATSGLMLYTLSNIYGFISTPTTLRRDLWLRSTDTGAPTTTNSDIIGPVAYYDVLSATNDSSHCQVTDTRPSDANKDANGSTLKYRVTTDAAGTTRNPSCTAKLISGAPDPLGAGCGWINSGTWSPYFWNGPSWSSRSSITAEGNTYWYGGSCRGTCNYGTGYASNCSTTGSTNGSNVSTTFAKVNTTYPVYSTLNIGGTNYTNVVVGGTGSEGCSWQTGYGTGTSGLSCTTRKTTLGLGTNETCNYSETCTVSIQVYNKRSSSDYLYHSCAMDELNNLRTTKLNPTQYAWWNTSGANSPQGYSGSNSNLWSATQNFNWNSNGTNPKINVFSSNYLNWKYGAKRNGNPVGRKTRLQIAKDALVSLVANSDGMRIGIEIFNDLPSDPTLATSTGSSGGRIIKAIQRMGTTSSSAISQMSGAELTANTQALANRTTLTNTILSVYAKAATPLTESLYEAYSYFSGRAPYFGTKNAITANLGATYTTGVAGDVTASPNPDNVQLSGQTNYGAFIDAAMTKYYSPMMNNPVVGSPQSCQKNAIVLITDGGADRDTSVNTKIQGLSYNENGVSVRGVNSSYTWSNSAYSGQIPDPSASPANSTPMGPADPNNGNTVYPYLDELGNFMGNADISPGAKNVTTDSGPDSIPGIQNTSIYTIGFGGINASVLNSTAVSSGGSYFLATDEASLRNSLLTTFNAIKNMNPTVASGTVPISSLNRTENSTDVYLSFFQPTSKNTWNGTLKKFQLGSGSSICGTGVDLCLTGQTVLTAPSIKNIEQTVIDPITNSSSVIVNPSTQTFWNTVLDGGYANKGGSGETLLNGTLYPNTRNIYTYTGSSSTLTDNSNLFISSNLDITKTFLGDPTMTDNTREMIINYLRGGDLTNSSCNQVGQICSTWRQWAHSDVQHSKSVIITYDKTTTPVGQYAFYATNDGLLHAVNTNTGQELWSFLVPSAAGQVKNIINDITGDQVYLADGTPSAYIVDSNSNGIIESGDKVYLYFGLRRGGNSYYALDISNISTPKFIWSIDNSKICSPFCSASASYSEMGQTWSTPIISKIKANTNPVLIFGAGYDNVTEDVLNRTGPDTKGRGLYVVDAFNGSLVKEFTAKDSTSLLNTPTFSFPSDPAVLNTTNDSVGYVDRVYIGDTAANLWRFDIGSPNKTDWKGKIIASLSPIPSNPSRKIFFPPAVAKQKTPSRYDAIYIATGDKEHPNLSSTNDAMFMLIDKDYGPVFDDTYTIALSDLENIGNSNTIGINTTNALNNTIKGWYRTFEGGEKGINAPTLFYNVLRFGTYASAAVNANACTPPGQGRLNEINALSGALFNLNNSSSISASDRYYSKFLTHGYISSGQVVVLNNTIYHIVTADSRLMASRINTLGKAQNIYWYIEGER